MADVTSVPTMKGRAPNCSLPVTGFQCWPVMKPSPNA